MSYELPENVGIDGVLYEIRSDYRAALDICTALSDPELSGEEKAAAALTILYPAFGSAMPPQHFEQAIRELYRFLNGGADEPDGRPQPRLVDWEQDFPLIAAPVNRIVGCEIRALPYLHWWTFLAAYQEIGDCTFAQVVGIRSKQARGRPLDKQERAFYRQNRKFVDFRRAYTQAEETTLREWGV